MVDQMFQIDGRVIIDQSSGLAKKMCFNLVFMFLIEEIITQPIHCLSQLFVSQTRVYVDRE